MRIALIIMYLLGILVGWALNEAWQGYKLIRKYNRRHDDSDDD